MMKHVFAGAMLAGLSLALHAATVFPALSRPALAVRAPHTQVLLAAAQAGQRIVAAGERGIVVLSDDGGASWRQARQVPVSTTLTALSFAGAGLGWAVGHGGVILHTRDGGDTWTRQTDGAGLAQGALHAADQALQADPGDPAAQRALRDAQMLAADGPDKPLLDVHFRDARNGWAVGAYNLFVETSDGGASWRSVAARLDNPRALHLYTIRSVGQAVFIAGEGGQLHRSLDGGRSFQALPSPYKGSWFALGIRGDGVLVAAGLRGNAWQSRDRGATWERLAGAPPVSFVSAAPLQDGALLLANQAGQLFASRSGAALAALPAPRLPPLSAVMALPDHTLLALGAGGAQRLPKGPRKEATR
ncbi:WD40/YVTN/BNR-like repeat-containing protein [Massilia niastensis]|uniref:WD40/YVTN/BNR-like repeat-containing protein n=1 Tax=Massilia niastensis TaxID=544911 RepID=UPI0003713A0C|nr:YCF48-related protein [Massilia niastensis]